MSPTLTTFLFEAANFLVLAAALGWLFFRPVRQAIVDYRTQFESDNQRAAETLAEAETIRRSIQAEHEKLKAKLDAMQARELANAKAQADNLLAEARLTADREREQSRLDASRISDSQRDVLAATAATAAAESVGQLLTQIGGPELQSALVRSACGRLAELAEGTPEPDSRNGPSCASHYRGLPPIGQSLAPVKVESAQPLTEDQMTEIKHALGNSYDTADFRVVCELGNGIRVSTSMGLVDASTMGLRAFACHWLVNEVKHRSNLVGAPMPGEGDA